MSPLSMTDREMILDFCLGQLSEEHIANIETLIQSNSEAKQLFESIKGNLQPLSTADLLTPCPDELAELTVSRLVEASKQDDQKLQSLIREEQARASTIQIPLWHRLTQIVAVAAIVVISLTIAIPTLNHVKEESLRQRCEAQLATIFSGMDQYRQDHDGQLPTVTVASGAPWWKVGYQGEENHSNTRSVWMLASQGFVEPEEFVCPARMRTITPPPFDQLAVDQYKDFPDRTYLSYSPRVNCDKTPKDLTANSALMADINPITDPMENAIVANNNSNSFHLRLSQSILQANSRNHNGRGQNILLGDGSTVFNTTRFVGNDDIYTISSMEPGAEIQGCETPDCSSDTFLAP